MTSTITKTATTATTAMETAVIMPSTTPMPKSKPITPQTVAQNYFNRKIGNTTFVVSVSFSEKAKESMDDKIIRLVASDIQQGVMQ